MSRSVLRPSRAELSAARQLLSDVDLLLSDAGRRLDRAELRRYVSLVRSLLDGSGSGAVAGSVEGEGASG